MKTVVCASMQFAPEVLTVATSLHQYGHEAIVSKDVAHHVGTKLTHTQSLASKVANDAIRTYYQYIEASDAILVLNYDKNGIAGYVGPNCFLEIGFAYALHKSIFLLQTIPDMSYRDEIVAMDPTILNGDLSRIPA